jgi:hypothetical protein
MERTITISDAHSESRPKQVLKVKMEGGSPWYGYIWINDVIYTVTEGARTVKIQKSRFPKI